MTKALPFPVPLMQRTPEEQYFYTTLVFALNDLSLANCRALAQKCDLEEQDIAMLTSHPGHAISELLLYRYNKEGNSGLAQFRSVLEADG